MICHNPEKSCHQQKFLKTLMDFLDFRFTILKVRFSKNQICAHWRQNCFVGIEFEILCNISVLLGPQ